MRPIAGPPPAPAAGAELLDAWRRALTGRRMRVALADGEDPRAAEAAIALHAEGIIDPVLIGRSGGIRQAAEDAGLELPPQIAIADVGECARDAGLADTLAAAHAGRGVSHRQLDALLRDPLFVAAAMLRRGAVDAAVGGAARPTADLLRAGLRVIGLAPGVGTVSSCFLMVLPGGGRLAYADCAVLPDPSAQQLADIAVATAQTYASLTGEEPIVAMLSFSTHGSADHAHVRKVRQAVRLLRQSHKGLVVDGELQFDAAYVATVGSRKAPGSPVAGRANVLIFPDLDAGNIAYKITERLAHATALGPIVQGLRAPFHDLSRGCSAGDITAMATIGALQSATSTGAWEPQSARRVTAPPAVG